MAAMSKYAVAIHQLGFRYAGSAGDCFQQLNLEVGVGERFGLFGPNGAGKTTLMNCMTGLLSFKEGTIELLGQPINQNRKATNQLFGFVPQDFSFYHELTPVENLAFFGAWSGMRKTEIKKRTTELLEILDLSAVRNKQVQKFSGGMKRKLNLAIGVIHQPKILFLDEPTVGVDVQTRKAIISYLKELNSNGTTLIYTSHQLNEAEELCDKIALIDNGRIIAHNALDKLLLEYREIGLEGLFIQLTGKKYTDL
ncbi:MAG: ABC transporter ATP-binding protein [Ferruginibacter sp.]|nr:ABC transporter ATP-binding protein [Ferruginibacter sp.]